MAVKFEPVLTKFIDNPDQVKIDTYIRNGGYKAAEKALKSMKSDDLVKMVKDSNLRGRGGAGFPTGLKWSFVPKGTGKPVYLAVNADESEPGTFKDRLLMEKDPHQLLEGIIITAHAIGAETAYIYIRGEFYHPAKILDTAIKEAYDKKYLGKNIFGTSNNLDVYVHRGAGAYICGEETSLLNSIEGKRAYPRVKPPFPAVQGLFDCPTIINNVETLCCVTHIVNKGVNWFTSIGTEKSKGPKLFAVSGHVKNPGIYELPMSITLRELIYDVCGGMLDEKRKLKAIIPGGSSSPVLSADSIGTQMCYDALQKEKSMLGSAGVIVMDDSVCMVDAAINLTRFYCHESCGQCTPCREGGNWLLKILESIEEGTAKPDDIDLLLNACWQVEGKTVCPFGEAMVWPIQAFVARFREEFEEHIQYKRCPIDKDRSIRR
jgi:NADH-quinone oxidoreductase subunit F